MQAMACALHFARSVLECDAFAHSFDSHGASPLLAE
jgi:hypothetical protein